MAFQLRRGTQAQIQATTLVQGELAYATDTKKVYAGDGTTLGGTELGAGATNLNGLSDVVITAPINSGQILKYDGTNWINDTNSGGGGGSSLPAGTIAFLPISYSNTAEWVKLDGSLVNYPAINQYLITESSISGGTQLSNSLMTSSASSYIDVRTPSMAHDGIQYEYSQGWHSSYEYQPWLQFTFNDSTPRTVNAFRMWGRMDGFNMGDYDGFVVYGSNNGGNNLTEILSVVGNGVGPPGYGYKDYAITSPGSYSTYRIKSLATIYAVIAEWELFTGATISTQYKLPGPANGFNYGQGIDSTKFDFYIKVV
jgi:hypothetical protein